MAAVREISKRFEETVRGTTAEVLAHFQAQAPRGEFVLVLAGAKARSGGMTPDEALALARRLLDEGRSTNQAAKEAAAASGLAKRTIYQALLDDQ